MRIALRPEVLTSDERIVAALSHEFAELTLMRARFRHLESLGEEMTMAEFRAHTRAGNERNFHSRAWDYANHVLRANRDGLRPLSPQTYLGIDLMHIRGGGR